MRTSSDRGRLAALSLTALLVCADVASAERSLYDWVAVAPIVAAVESRGHDGKYVEVVVTRTLRGELAPRSTIRVDLRHANADRDRETHRRALRLDEGGEYLVLLEPAPSRKRNAKLPTFDLVRGVLGARELPAEGAAGILDGLATLIEVQGLDGESARWERLATLLDATNPVVLENVLQQFVKFDRGAARDLPAIRPLLDHPSPPIRRSAARLIGDVLARGRAPGDVDLAGIRTELVGLARRDPDVDVRVSATRALDALDDPAVERILGEIADADPDQDVRFEAQRLLYERRRRPAVATDGHGGGPN